MNRLAKVINIKYFSWVKCTGVISGLILIGMMVITVVDVVLRRVFNSPLYGTYEAVSFMLGLLFFFTMTFSTYLRHHFGIDILVKKMKPSIARIVTAVVYFGSAIICLLLGWQLIDYGFGQKAHGSTGMEFTSLPIYPFIFVEGACALLMGIIFFIHEFQDFNKTPEKVQSIADKK